jgi:leucyl aminopeptidase
MQITSNATSLIEVNADWLIVGIWELEGLKGGPADLDTKVGGILTRLMDRGDMTGKAKELTPIFDTHGIRATRILVVGLGPRAKIDFAGLVMAAAAAARFVTAKSHERVALAVPEQVPGIDPEGVARALGVGFMQGSEGPGLRKTKADRFSPTDLWLLPSAGHEAEAIEQGARRADIEGRAVSLARTLVNTPPCDLYPETFADRARNVAQKTGMECVVLGEQQLQAERMHALLAVARGSERPPCLVLLRHRLGGNGQTLGLVGKGVTFDSGGLSLKTNEQMVDMKCDMAGAAAVLGAMQAAAELKLPVNLLGVLALVENLPSGKAMKLGDVLHARNGKTIEVLNTDAEGRLILADALAYAVDQKVNHLVDLATLTGACMVALGHDVAGLMSNNEAWSQRVAAAAGAVGEKTWPLPMFPLYTDMIKSDVADIRNTGGSRYAGAITAAKFLEEFVSDVPWVHLDIAGPAWAEHENPTRDSGGTGCFVRTLVELARGYERGEPTRG